ncbi:hypothetical protein WMY93_023893 [Mugilogobius chulae]|uniref:SET domain-containing protein n=1 Tax=Mugilogobius chulae TaxID=88201 RepID=A0AAW0NGL3_9GOBI
MATEAKRPKIVEDRQISLNRFLAWCEKTGLTLSGKVYVSHQGTVAEYGMLAKDDIEEGEVLFIVPRKAILHQDSSKVSGVLDKDDDDDDDDDKAPNPPMMVPMADMLNHIANHNANLEFTPESLKMVSIRPICKGEEVFNTYGQMPNWQLLHMYGFTEPFPSNTNDTVDITVRNFCTAAQGFELSLLDEKWKLLNQMEGDNAIIFGNQGCLTDTTLNTILKVFCMSPEEFEDFKNNEGWEDDDNEEDIAFAFSNEGLPKLKSEWKKLFMEQPD